jgi:Transposase DDE domain
MVAIPGIASVAPDANYNMSHFIYDEINDTYTCPQNQILSTNGNPYQKSKNRNYYTVKHYKTSACPQCNARALCTKNVRGRLIERSEFTPYIDQNKQNIGSRPELYKQRQSIVEHPYGTIKRQWGFYYVITKRGLKRASSDVGFMFIAYNLRRLMNIIDKNVFRKFLQELVFKLYEIMAFTKAINLKISHAFFSLRFALNILRLPKIVSKLIYI